MSTDETGEALARLEAMLVDLGRKCLLVSEALAANTAVLAATVAALNDGAYLSTGEVEGDALRRLPPALRSPAVRERVRVMLQA